MDAMELARAIEQLTPVQRNAIEILIEACIISTDPDGTRLTPVERKQLDASILDTDTMLHTDLKRELGF